MNMETKSAKSALLGLGYFEMTDEGELTRLDVGRDGKRHIPKGCKKISGDIFSMELDNSVSKAKIEFCENARIILADNTVFVFKFSAKGNSRIIFDLRYSYDITEVRSLLRCLDNVEAEYIFSEKIFEKQIARLILISEFQKGKGLQFLEKNDDVTVLIGATDVTEKFKDFDILEGIMEALYFDIDEDFQNELCDCLESWGFCEEGNFRSARWHGI